MPQRRDSGPHTLYTPGTSGHPRAARDTTAAPSTVRDEQQDTDDDYEHLTGDEDYDDASEESDEGDVDDEDEESDDEGDHETQQEVKADERRDGCKGACSKTHGRNI